MTLTPDQRRLFAWAAIAAVIGFLLFRLGAVLMPFVMGAVLGYALKPAVDALVRWRVPRALAVAMVETAFFVMVVALCLLVLPVLSTQIPILKAKLPGLLQQVVEMLRPALGQLGVSLPANFDDFRALVMTGLDGNLQAWGARLLSSLSIGGSYLMAFVGYAVLVPVVLFYVLLDWHDLVRRWGTLVPPRWRSSVGSFLQECDTMLGQYLRGQAMVMGILALYYSLALWACGFDLAWPVGLFTGLAVFIPYLGFGLGLIMALLAGALQFSGWYGVLCVAGVYGIGQVIEGFFLTPRLVGERIGLSPLMVIFALMAFGHLLGFLGVLIALPLSAVTWVALRRAHAAYLGSPLYKG